MKKLINRETVTFVICAGIYNVISIAAYWVMLFFGMYYNLANAISYVIGIVFAYLLNMKFVFRQNYSMRNLVRFCAAYGSNMLFSLIVMFIIVDVLHINEYLANLVMLAVNSVYNFTLTKLWVIKKKKILILGGSHAQSAAVECAKAMNVECVVADMYPDAYCAQLADHFENVSTLDEQGLEAVIVKHKVNGITTVASDRPVPVMAKLAKRHRFACVNESSAKIASNKYQMRECLKRYGTPIPAYRKVRTFDELSEAIHDFQLPCILKPCDNSGSRGVCIVRSLDELKSCYDYSSAYANDGNLLIEDYMQGPEVSVELFVHESRIHVLQITDKLTTGAPYFVEMGHSQPSRLDQDVLDKIAEVSKSAVSALGIDQGPVHAELIVTSSGPKIVEVGARMGGDYITSDLVKLSTGIDMMKATMQRALKMTPELKKRHDQGACIRFLSADKGIVCEITGLEDLLKEEGVIKAVCFKKPGDVIEDVKNSSNRCGFVICTGKDAAEAVERCEKAVSLIQIKVRQEEKE